MFAAHCSALRHVAAMCGGLKQWPLATVKTVDDVHGFSEIEWPMATLILSVALPPSALSAGGHPKLMKSRVWAAGGQDIKHRTMSGVYMVLQLPTLSAASSAIIEPPEVRRLSAVLRSEDRDGGARPRMKERPRGL